MPSPQEWAEYKRLEKKCWDNICRILWPDEDEANRIVEESARKARITPSGIEE